MNNSGNYYPYFNNGNNNNGYNGYNMNPYRGIMPINYQQMQSQYMQQAPTKIDRVNGKEGAEQYFLAPNSEALLLDTSNPIVWLKQTDSAGYGTVSGFKIIPLQETVINTPTDYSLLEQRISELEKRIEDLSYEQPDLQSNSQQSTAIQQSNSGGFKSKQHSK